MGSRTKPNWGGSGEPYSRKSRPKYDNHKEISYKPINSIEELELYLSGDKIACLLCGSEHKSLGHHLSRTHSMAPRDYKEQFNIPVTRSLVGADLKARKKAITERIWRECPQMEKVRKGLLNNLDRLDGTKHKTKSTLPAIRNRKQIKEIKKIQLDSAKDKYRTIYLDIINQAINNEVTLYSIKNNTHQIYNFAKRYPEDIEFSERLALVKKPQHGVSP